MTLQEFFNLLDDPNNAAMVISFLVIVPIAAWMVGFIAGKDAHLPPWNFIYAVLIYLICIPGIFAVTLNAYLFLFEQHSIMHTNIYTQIFPVISMIATLLIIRANVDLGWIPGFNRLPGLLMVIFATIAIMWFVDRTSIRVFSFLRFEYVLMIFLLLLFIIRFGWSRLMGKSS